MADPIAEKIDIKSSNGHGFLMITDENGKTAIYRVSGKVLLRLATDIAELAEEVPQMADWQPMPTN